MKKLIAFGFLASSTTHAFALYCRNEATSTSRQTGKQQHDVSLEPSEHWESAGQAGVVRIWLRNVSRTPSTSQELVHSRGWQRGSVAFLPLNVQFNGGSLNLTRFVRLHGNGDIAGYLHGELNLNRPATPALVVPVSCAIW